MPVEDALLLWAERRGAARHGLVGIALPDIANTRVWARLRQIAPGLLDVLARGGREEEAIQVDFVLGHDELDRRHPVVHFGGAHEEQVWGELLDASVLILARGESPARNRLLGVGRDGDIGVAWPAHDIADVRAELGRQRLGGVDGDAVCLELVALVEGVVGARWRRWPRAAHGFEVAEVGGGERRGGRLRGRRTAFREGALALGHEVEDAARGEGERGGDVDEDEDW